MDSEPLLCCPLCLDANGHPCSVYLSCGLLTVIMCCPKCGREWELREPQPKAPPKNPQEESSAE